jgi:hypothetical protein
MPMCVDGQDNAIRARAVADGSFKTASASTFAFPSHCPNAGRGGSAMMAVHNSRAAPCPSPPPTTPKRRYGL